jgi:hypothetical protein
MPSFRIKNTSIKYSENTKTQSDRKTSTYDIKSYDTKTNTRRKSGKSKGMKIKNDRTNQPDHF